MYDLESIVGVENFTGGQRVDIGKRKAGLDFFKALRMPAFSDAHL